MTAVFAIVMLLLVAVSFVTLGATIELFRQVQQLRDHLELTDMPTPIDIRSVGELADSVGLPAELNTVESALVLVLTDKCGTCHGIAAALAGTVPQGLWILVPSHESSGLQFITRYGLSGERVLVDEGSRVVDGLGIDMSPVGVFVRSGRIEHAESLPTSRLVFMNLPANRTGSRRAGRPLKKVS